jgi:hypothetical protein
MMWYVLHSTAHTVLPRPHVQPEGGWRVAP